MKEGFLLLNKPANEITSFGVVHAIKRLLPRKTKIGHTGTLDDFASGLLIVCVGRSATKLSSALMGCDKEYVVRAKLGEATDSLDRTGKIIATEPFEHITAEMLHAAMKSLQPSYFQIPPIYSALKHHGSPLYKLARERKMDMTELADIAKQKGREVFIKEIELIDFQPPFFTLRAVVSKGTYVRSLAYDIAQKCGLSATTYDLERTKINNFTLCQAALLKNFGSLEDIQTHLFACEELQMLEKIS